MEAGASSLPAEWVETATARQVSNGSDPKSDWEQGYGYQFWRCRHGLYRGDGAFGQFCIVMPEQDAVVAITSGTKDMAGVMDLLWEHLLPALKAAPLAADAGAQDALGHKLGALVLQPQAGSATSPMAAKVAGRRYVFPANDDKAESVALEITRGAVDAREPRRRQGDARARRLRPVGEERRRCRSPGATSASRRAAPGRPTTRTRRGSACTRRRSCSRPRCASPATR